MMHSLHSFISQPEPWRATLLYIYGERDKEMLSLLDELCAMKVPKNVAANENYGGIYFVFKLKGLSYVSVPARSGNK